MIAVPILFFIKKINPICLPEKATDVFIFGPHGTYHSSLIRIILNNFYKSKGST